MAVKEVKKIGVSTSPDDVLEYDKDGFKLVFDEKDFLVLSPEVLDKLSKATKTAYALTKLDYDLEQDEGSGEVEDRFNIAPEYKRTYAGDLLGVKVREGLAKYHCVPKDVDKFRRQGWDVAQKSDLADGTEESIRITIGGYDDLVLMVTPEENHAKMRAAKKEFNERRRGAAGLEQTKKELESVGHDVKFSETSFTED